MSREQNLNLPANIANGAVFSEPAPHASKELTNLVQIAVKNGGWEKISDTSKRYLAMHLVDGLDNNQIGDEMGVSKQYVSQTLKPLPNELLRRTVLGIIRQPITLHEKEQKTSELVEAYTEYEQSLLHKKRGKV